MWGLSCGAWDLSLWHRDFLVVEHGLSYSAACGIVPDQDPRPVSFALAGEYFTTEPTREAL